MDPDALRAVFAERPALHRFPGSMGERTLELSKALVQDYDGRAERVWETAKDGAELFANLKALPGFGDQKAKIFIALLAKRMGVQPPGWQEAAGIYADNGCYSVADVDGPDSLAKVREYKRAAKADRFAGKKNSALELIVPEGLKAARLIVTLASAPQPSLPSTTVSGRPSRAVTYQARGASSTISWTTVNAWPVVHRGATAYGSAR